MRNAFRCALVVFFSAAGLFAAPPASPTLPANVKAERNIPYVPNGSPAQQLDLYVPSDSAKPLPLVIWIHGGGWSKGDKAQCPALPLLTRGYAVASLNYRFSQEAKFPAQIQDCFAAIRWLRANAKKYNLDPQKIGVWGGSAGGHLVALIETAGGKKAFPAVGGNEDQSDRVQAVCDFYGPTDFTRMDEQAIASAPFKHDSPTSPESVLIGGAVQENRDKALLASPMHYISKDLPPILILHGTADPLVPIGQSEIFVEALKKAGVDVLLQKLPGAGHGGPAFNRPAARDLVFAFFDKHLMGKDVKVEVIPEASLSGK